MGRFLAQQRKDPQHKVAFPRELTLLNLQVFEVLTQVWEGRLLYKRRRRGDTPGKGGKTLPVPIEGIGDKVLDQLISIGEN